MAMRTGGCPCMRVGAAEAASCRFLVWDGMGACGQERKFAHPAQETVLG